MAKILIIEDNPANMKLATLLMSKAGHTASCAVDAETGLTLARADRPDLILMDIQLPGMDGLAATRLLKNDPATVGDSHHRAHVDGDEGRSGQDQGRRVRCLHREAAALPGAVRGDRHAPGPGQVARLMSVPDARVLIVDDELHNRKLLDLLLRAEGYVTESAADAAEAMTAIARQPPDLIMLDVMMPGMDGYQLAAMLKADPVTLHIPIIMLTAQLDRNSRLAGLKAGAEEFLTKPFESAELRLRVRNLLRLKAFSDFVQEPQHDSRTAGAGAGRRSASIPGRHGCHCRCDHPGE